MECIHCIDIVIVIVIPILIREKTKLQFTNYKQIGDIYVNLWGINWLGSVTAWLHYTELNTGTTAMHWRRYYTCQWYN